MRGAQNAPGSRAGPAVVALHRGALGSRACKRGESTRAHAAPAGRAARAAVAGDGFMMSRDVLLMNVRGGPAARALSTDTEEYVNNNAHESSMVMPPPPPRDRRVDGRV